MSHPLRIQRRRTKGFRLPPGAVSITRPGPWGNPYRSAFGFGLWLSCMNVSPDQLVKPMDEAELGRRRLWILEHVHELREKQIACFCPLDQDCHGDILASLANKPEG